MPNWFWRRGAAALLPSLFVTGCVAVGTGTRTLIKAPTSDATAQRFFPHLVTRVGASDGERVVVFRDNAEPAWCVLPSRASKLRSFQSYLKRKYGTPSPESAAVSLEVRDLGRVPVLSSSLQAIASAEVAKIMTDATATDEQKIARKNLLLAQLVNAPQSFEVKTLNRMVSGCELYYYYPHVEIEFSADVLSPNLVDRFSELILMVRLSDNDAGRHVRLVNFDPKTTDIAEFSRGTLKDQAQAYIKGTYGVTTTGSASTVNNVLANATNSTPATSATRSLSIAPTLGGEVGYTYSEAYERDLKDAIERKTVAVIEDGQTFIVDLRAVRQVRIGGSYAFDLMIEVPATSELVEKNCISQPSVDPKTKGVRGEVVLIGLVRHVSDIGRTGILRRVPEAENDDVYEEVVLRTLPDTPLWTFNGIPAVRPDTQRPQVIATVDVLSNVDDARYVVGDSRGMVLGEGGGKRSQIEVDAQVARQVTVRFLDVVRSSQSGKTIVLTATPRTRSVAVGPKIGTVQVLGEYR